MKIAIINQPQDLLEASEDQRGSVAIVQWQLARRLATRHEVTIYAACGPGQPFVDTWQGVQIRRVPFRTAKLQKAVQLVQSILVPAWPYFASRWYSQEYFTEIAAALRSQAVDVIHLPQQFQFAGVLKRAAGSAKLVLHLHQDEIAHLDPKLVLSALRNVDAIVGVSDYISARLRSRFPDLSDHIHTIGNGVDVERFSPASRSAGQRPTRVLFVGRVSPDKGLHILFDAFASLASERSDLELTVVGKPGFLPYGLLRLLVDDRAALDTLRDFYGRSAVSVLRKVVLGYRTSYMRALMQRLPPEIASRVHFAPSIPLDALVELYRRADVLVLPSVWNESYGLPIAEAMASGVPVIASHCGGVPELVHHGISGLMVPRGDRHALTKAMRSLLEDRQMRERMGAAARVRATELLAWERSAAKLEDVYASLVAQRSVRDAEGTRSARGPIGASVGRCGPASTRTEA